MRFEWPVIQEEGGLSSPEKDKKEESSSPSRYSLQTMLDIQRTLIDGRECRIIEAYSEGATQVPTPGMELDKGRQRRKLSVLTKIDDLVRALISHDVDHNPYILGWDTITHLSPYFLYSQILVQPLPSVVSSGLAPSQLGAEGTSNDTNTCWSHQQLAFWTYVLSIIARSDQIAVKEDFLDQFLSTSCYLRWATQLGGLWIGFTSQGATSVHFAASDGEILLSRSSQVTLWH